VKDLLAPEALFCMSVLSRAQGLHDAILREIKHSNPHAVFPLMRAYAELATLMLYVVEHPNYIQALMDHPRDLPAHGPHPKSMQAIIDATSHRMPGTKSAYTELSQFTHFGHKAFWSPHTLKGDRFSWQSAPRWKQERDALIACAWALELSEAMFHTLRDYGRKHLDSEAPESA
jgi:hypothetical protein